MVDYHEIQKDRLKLRVYVLPKSSKTAWDGFVEREKTWWIRLKISSPPVDGAANKEVLKFVAKEFKTAKSNITIMFGVKSRFKVLEIEGIDEEKVQTFIKANKPANN